MSSKKAFSLLELLLVVAIMGILLSLGSVNYNKMKERAVDKEAIANLKLIQAAEKTYRMEMSVYYAGDAVADLNPNLKLSLSETNWDFATDAAGTGTAERVAGSYIRTWTMLITDDDEPDCTATPPGACL
ncbi:type II secretion system protein [bacterium]|nr:MAG: type II secretion system protein [bacterium]